MLVLLHRDSPHPWFEVLGVEDGGRALIVRPLWNRADQVGQKFKIDKAAYRNYGYYPKEVEDALIPELQA